VEYLGPGLAKKGGCVYNGTIWQRTRERGELSPRCVAKKEVHKEKKKGGRGVSIARESGSEFHSAK